MRALIVATSAKWPNMEEEIGLGQRPRLDYVELARRLEVPYMDYDQPRMYNHRGVRRLEERLRLDIFWARQIAQQAKEQDCGVILSMSERVGIPLSFMLDRGIKHVVMLHHPMSPAKLRLLKALRIPYRWDKILPLSRAEASALQQAFCLEEERIQPLHMAIDTEFYKPSAGSDVSSEQNFILSLGRTHRDYPTLIRALHTLPQVTCHISATSAWARQKAGYEDEVIPDNVEIVSYDHPSVIRDAYAASRFVVIPLQPRTSQWSAGSVSVLQPQAMGKPVIATRTPGLSDYVLDGETGILVEGGNQTAMAEAIEYLWQNPEKAAAMGRRAREWVVANFSLDQWLDDIGQLLRIERRNV